MAEVQEEVCAFCKKSGELMILQDTSEEILAHYYCMLFSPGVITSPKKDSQDNTVEFDISSVIKEINRGKKLRCSFCKRNGATVGCYNNSCKKTYHCECVNEVGGVPIEDEVTERYIAFCPDHLGDIEVVQKFPANVDKLMNLSNDQKSKLIESYKEAERQMSRIGDTTKAAQAFWNLCRENKCREFFLNSVKCNMKSVFQKIIHEEPKDKDFEQAFAFLQASGCFADFMNGTEDDQTKMNSRTSNRQESYNESDSENAGSSTEVKGQRIFTRDENPKEMESESPDPSQTSNKVGQCTTEVEGEWSKTSSLSVNSKVKRSSRVEDLNGMQSELSKSPLKGNRIEGSCREKDHDDIQCEITSESRRKEESSKGEYLDKMETESPAASLFSHSASRKSDETLTGNTSRRHRVSKINRSKAIKANLRVLKTQQQTLLYQLKQQTKDGDSGFATNLIQFLRKVPEDKRLFTQISILNVLSSVLDQQPMSISNSAS
ncbi:PHD finger protein 11-like isoform X4 [Rana temporaria]|uniref:PHD finger protein 11-like isoform X4 n=1 Tax=Rana temporaria TaxID=8407 RepID=UPI001AACB4C0|nr:PHD finger protein 11-like isoform X4 [Rana temporaria]